MDGLNLKLPQNPAQDWVEKLFQMAFVAIAIGYLHAVL